MLIFKLVSALGIFLSTSIMGFLYGSSFSARMDNLIYLKQAIRILETEIVYAATPLPEALLKTYRKSNPKIALVFKTIGEDLTLNKREDLLTSFRNVSGYMEGSLSFKNQDIELFLSLGNILGASSREDQEKSISLVLRQMDFLIEEARQEKLTNEKLYKNLGVLSGLALIILLI